MQPDKTITVCIPSLEVGAELGLKLAEPAPEASARAVFTIQATTIDGIRWALRTTIDVVAGESLLQVPSSALARLAPGLYVAGPIVVLDAQEGEIARFDGNVPEALLKSVSLGPRSAACQSCSANTKPF